VHVRRQIQKVTPKNMRLAEPHLCHVVGRERYRQGAVPQLHVIAVDAVTTAKPPTLRRLGTTASRIAAAFNSCSRSSVPLIGR